MVTFEKDDKEIVYLDAAATSWPKSKNVIDAIGEVYKDPLLTNMRSTGMLQSLGERISDNISILGVPDGTAIYYTGGATDSLNIVIGSLKNICTEVLPKCEDCGNGIPLFIDPTVHNAVTYNIPRLISDCGSKNVVLNRLSSIELYSKLKPFLLLPNKVDEFKRGVYILDMPSDGEHLIGINSISLVQNATRSILSKINDSIVIIDASQYASINSDFGDIFKSCEKNNNVLIVVFGFHKKFGLIPGGGVILCSRNFDGIFQRITFGGGTGSDVQFYSNTSQWPAGTFNVTPFYLFSKVLSKDIVLEKQHRNFTTMWFNIIQRLLENMGATCHNLIGSDVLHYTHPTRSVSELSAELDEYADLQNVQIIRREGDLCRSLLRDMIRKESGIPEFDGFIRISK